MKIVALVTKTSLSCLRKMLQAFEANRFQLRLKLGEILGIATGPLPFRCPYRGNRDCDSVLSMKCDKISDKRCVWSFLLNVNEAIGVQGKTHAVGVKELMRKQIWLR